MPLFANVFPNTRNILIETGTYKGEGVRKALNMGFQEIHSIELYEKLHKENVNKFKNNSNVHLYQGDSGIILQKVMDTINQPCVIFLDAHYCGVGSESGLGEVWIPIKKELLTIKNHPINTHTIIIDDLNAMDNSHYDKTSGKWVGSPGLNFILDILVEINPNYEIKAYLKENQLVAVPTENDVALGCKENILQLLKETRIQEKRKIVSTLLKQINEKGLKTDIQLEDNLSLEQLEERKINLSNLLEV